MKEKLAKASYNNPNELRNQRSEIFQAKQFGCLVGKIYLFFRLILFFLLAFKSIKCSLRQLFFGQDYPDDTVR